MHSQTGDLGFDTIFLFFITLSMTVIRLLKSSKWSLRILDFFKARLLKLDYVVQNLKATSYYIFHVVLVITYHLDVSNMLKTIILSF